MLSDDQLALIVQDFYAYVLDQENRTRLRLGAIPEDARLRRAEFYKKVALQARKDLSSNVLGNVDIIAWAMMRKHNTENLLGKDEKNQLKQALLRAGIHAAEAVCARYEGDFKSRGTSCSSKKPRRYSPRQLRQYRQGHPSGNHPPAFDAPSFSTVSADFITRQKQLRRWENQTAAQNEKSYELFSVICGDYPLAKDTKSMRRDLRTSSNDCLLTTARQRNIAARRRNRYCRSTPPAGIRPNGCPFAR